MSSIDVKLNSNVKLVGAEFEKATKKALESVGIYVEAETKKRCPVDTGRLRASYEHFEENERTEVIGTQVDYGVFVEIGTSRAKAQPHLRPAIDDNRGNIGKIIKSAYES